MTDVARSTLADPSSLTGLALALALFGCGDDARPTGADDGLFGITTFGTDDGIGDGDGDGGPKLDLASLPDTPDDGSNGPIIPETCAQAQAGESTVGCLFFGVDLDSHDAVEDQQFAIVVSNVQQDQSATVLVERKQGGIWAGAAPAVNVGPLDLHVFNLPPNNQDDSGIRVGGAYRVSSDVPIIAYQFNPIDGASSYLSDASLLYPVPTWDNINHVVGWRVINDGNVQGAYVTIAAAQDGTQIQITPSIATLAGPGIPAGVPGVPFSITLNEGDIAEVMTKVMGQGMTGTRVESDHPVAVFSGNECTFIPTNVYACDHLEEQLSGVRLWGQHFIASRVPPRSASSDPSLWQIYASEDATQINLTMDPEITGIPTSNFVLNAGQVVEFYVSGPAALPGDFEIEANKPIAVLNYMTGSENPGAGIGDPAMVQISPIEQFLPRYVVLVPGTWIYDFAVITRVEGATILLDDLPISDAMFVPVADSGYEVARIPIPDGIHVLDGDNSPFSVIIIGYDTFDSYAYLGGTGTGVINPNPIG